MGKYSVGLSEIGGRYIKLCAAAITLATIITSIYYMSMREAVALGDVRTISLRSVHTKETLTVTYKRNGRYDSGAMVKINHLMRDWRADRPTKMDPALIDLLWELHRELGSKKPIHLISGFRSSKTNSMLRRIGRRVARRSMHMHGQAADVYFPDVPVKRLRESALLRERGGVGYYPRSGKHGFVHIDTGNVRHWPRMNPVQLAKLFKSRGTRHRPGSNRRNTLFASRKARKSNVTNFAALTQPATNAIPIPRLKPVYVAAVKPKLTTASTLTASLTPDIPKPRNKPFELASLAPLPGIDRTSVPQTVATISPASINTKPVTNVRSAHRTVPSIVTASINPLSIFGQRKTSVTAPAFPEVIPNAAKARRAAKRDLGTFRVAGNYRFLETAIPRRESIAPGLMINRTRKGNLLMSRHQRRLPNLRQAALTNANQPAKKAGAPLRLPGVATQLHGPVR